MHKVTMCQSGRIGRAIGRYKIAGALYLFEIGWMADQPVHFPRTHDPPIFGIDLALVYGITIQTPQ